MSGVPPSLGRPLSDTKHIWTPLGRSQLTRNLGSPPRPSRTSAEKVQRRRHRPEPTPFSWASWWKPLNGNAQKDVFFFSIFFVLRGTEQRPNGHQAADPTAPDLGHLGETSGIWDCTSVCDSASGPWGNQGGRRDRMIHLGFGARHVWAVPKCSKHSTKESCSSGSVALWASQSSVQQPKHFQPASRICVKPWKRIKFIQEDLPKSHFPSFSHKI